MVSLAKEEEEEEEAIIRIPTAKVNKAMAPKVKHMAAPREPKEPKDRAIMTKANKGTASQPSKTTDKPGKLAG